MFLSYYSLKSIFQLCCSRSGWGCPLGHSSPSLMCLQICLSVVHFTGVAATPLPAWRLSTFCLGILKSCLCLPAQSLTSSKFMYHHNQLGNRNPQHPIYVFSCSFGHPINLRHAVLDKFTTRYFILFVAIVKCVVFLISFSACLPFA